MVAKAGELMVARATMYRLYAAWRTDGLWGLVDGRSRRQLNPLGDLDDRIVAAVLEQADVESDLSSAGFRRFYRRVQARLDDRYGAGALALPPTSTARRKFNLILAGRHTFGDATTRHSLALSPTDTFQTTTASRPGEIVMMDATPLDVLAYDPVHAVALPVTLTGALDLCSRSLVAWRLVPGADQAVDESLLLADMMRPEPLRPHWPEELSYRRLGLPEDVLVAHDERFAAGAARPVIYPESIVIDHGRTYFSHSFTRACQLLGINVQPARVKRPTDKAQVERLFARIAGDFSEHLAGHKGRTTVRRGRVADTQARWTLAELEELFAEYVVMHYQQRPHHGLPTTIPGRNLSPNEAYAVAVTRCGWVPAPWPDDLYYQLLPIHWVEIHRYGVNLNYRVHDAPVLRQYEGCPSPYAPPVSARGRRPGREVGQRRRGQLWPVHVDPRNVLDAYFYSVNDERWYALRWAAAPDVMEPFTDSYYRHVRSLMVDRGQDPTDERLIATELMRFQGTLDDPQTWTLTRRRHKAKSRERARARLADRAATPTVIEEVQLEARRARAAAGQPSGAADEPADDVFDPRDIPALPTVWEGL